MQANAAGESAVYQEYEKEYTETINKVIDKTIDLMQAQALGGEATQVDPALEARNAALDKAIAEAIEELRELQKM
jgi:predicted phage-related endonuclease